jgi:NAD(P)-dependent dehydrogenase (short-subunit alcohol dehydrogenase family)
MLNWDLAASWQATAGGPLYSATKHSMLGLMRALHVDLRPHGIRVGIIHPWFAETNIITPEWKDYVNSCPTRIIIPRLT